MNKLLLGLLLGAGLGILDGGLAMVYHPQDPYIRAEIGVIVLMGTLKGLATGLIIGLLARRLGSLTVAIVVGLAVGFLLAVPLALWVGEYHLEILLPGGVMGTILGYATQQYGGRPPEARGRRGRGGHRQRAPGGSSDDLSAR